MGMWTKTKDFCKKHKTAIVSTMTCVVGVVGGVLLCKRLSCHSEDNANDDQPTLDISAIADTVSEDEDLSWADPMYQTIIGYEKKAEEGDNVWIEKPHWRDGWNKVEEIANEIKPFPGEYYVIEGTNPDCNEDFARWHVHHWVDEHAAYPTKLVTVQEEE